LAFDPRSLDLPAQTNSIDMKSFAALALKAFVALFQSEEEVAIEQVTCLQSG
jgi:hypothetical protein